MLSIVCIIMLGHLFVANIPFIMTFICVEVSFYYYYYYYPDLYVIFSNCVVGTNKTGLN